MPEEVLRTKDLSIYYFTNNTPVRAVDGVEIRLGKGEVLGVAGESGCGKTTLAMALMNLVPPPGRVVNGQIFLEGEPLVGKSEDFWRTVRWKKIAMVFQSAMNALNPVFRVGDQVAEAIMIHERVSRDEAYERVRELFGLVNIDPAMIYAYPHQLSGGMKQRVVIAMAIALIPTVLIADEPTTALDVTIQAQILDLLKYLQRRYRMSMIYISHDLAVIAEVANKVAIMYAGKIVEYGDVVDIFKSPVHPYTKGLIASVPTVSRAKEKELIFIPGSPPNLANPPKGCRFYERCPYATEKCKEEEPPLIKVGNSLVACHYAEEVKDIEPMEMWAKVQE